MLKHAFIALLLLIAHSGARAETDRCLKMVFEHYCLGGSLDEQLQQSPVKVEPRIQGERSGVILEKDGDRIYVMAYKGVIYKVLHTYEPKTFSTLKELRRRLQHKYGNYDDRSEYPDNTKNRARQISSIRRGEGELRNIWQLPGELWRIELGWTRTLGIFVAYFVNQLDAEQKQAALQGF